MPAVQIEGKNRIPDRREVRRPRLAIISTYDDLCGISGYTRRLEEQLQPLMDVEVFDLDQYLLRSPHKRVQKMADRHIKGIVARLGEFDSVNIQLEYGTLGRSMPEILRRYRWLTRAAPALSVTFHTILDEVTIPWAGVGQRLMRFRPDLAITAVAENMRTRTLARGAYLELRRQQWRKPVSVIVHTKRDMRLLRDLHRLKDVHHHPLCFVSAERAATIRTAASRDDFPMLKRLPPNAKLIGTFGFLSPYKGFETAVQALRYLPEDHHLLVFGGIHPQSIQRHQPLDPYLGRLMGGGHLGETLLDSLRGKDATSLTVDASARELLARHPQDLHDRMHFMGVLEDSEFMTAMALCDCVVLPYLEVGQTSSGPIAMATGMGCRIIASRTRAFLQYARYHPGRVEFFDIGNFAELARRIEAGPPPGPIPHSSYDTDSNAALYLRVSTPPGLQPPRPPDRVADILRPIERAPVEMA